MRRLAERLGIAPGTVARAYGELERIGLVVTMGMRGTLVAGRSAAAAGAPRESPDTLIGLLRPVAVAAFHLGSSAEDRRQALEEAMADIFPGPERPSF